MARSVPPGKNVRGLETEAANRIYPGMLAREESAIGVGEQGSADSELGGVVGAVTILDACDAGVDVEADGEREGGSHNLVLSCRDGVGAASDAVGLLVAEERSEGSASGGDATMSEESGYDDVMRENAIAMRDFEKYEKMSEWQHRLALVKSARSGMKLLLDDFPDIFYLHGCDVMKSLEYRFDTRLDDHVVPDEEYSFAWGEEAGEEAGDEADEEEGEEAGEEAGAEPGEEAGEDAGEDAGKETDGVGETLTGACFTVATASLSRL